MRIPFLTVLLITSVLTACTPAISPVGEKTNYAALFDVSDTLPDEPGLSFPYKRPTQAVFMHCFGLCPWENDPKPDVENNPDVCKGEHHAGIDIYPVPLGSTHNQESFLLSRSVEIIAPADATVVDPSLEGTTGADTTSYIVVLEFNEYWYAAFSFEPHSSTTYISQLQKNSILVEKDEHVNKGDVIGRLVIPATSVVEPSLHFSFFYLSKDDALENIWDIISTNPADVVVSDGSNLPSPQAPWNPSDLGIPTTFFCPEYFSSPRAQAKYRLLPKVDKHGLPCLSVCAYHSTMGGCGEGN